MDNPNHPFPVRDRESEIVAGDTPEELAAATLDNPTIIPVLLSMQAFAFIEAMQERLGLPAAKADGVSLEARMLFDGLVEQLKVKLVDAFRTCIERGDLATGMIEITPRTLMEMLQEVTPKPDDPPVLRA